MSRSRAAIHFVAGSLAHFNLNAHVSHETSNQKQKMKCQMRKAIAAFGIHHPDPGENDKRFTEQWYAMKFISSDERRWPCLPSFRWNNFYCISLIISHVESGFCCSTPRRRRCGRRTQATKTITPRDFNGIECNCKLCAMCIDNHSATLESRIDRTMSRLQRECKSFCGFHC